MQVTVPRTVTGIYRALFLPSGRRPTLRPNPADEGACETRAGGSDRGRRLSSGWALKILPKKIGYHFGLLHPRRRDQLAVE